MVSVHMKRPVQSEVNNTVSSDLQYIKNEWIHWPYREQWGGNIPTLAKILHGINKSCRPSTWSWAGSKSKSTCFDPDVKLFNLAVEMNTYTAWLKNYFSLHS